MLTVVYGGTFDPVHRGHVAVAHAALAQSGAERMLLLPCGDPPHRDAPRAPGALRAELLRLAFADDPRFRIDERELRRAGPSYMVDTLASLRAELGPAAPLALLLGQDAAQGLAGWHRWRDLPALAHLLLAPRPGGDPGLPEAVLNGWQSAAAAAALHQHPAGLYWILPQAVSDASATRSREAMARGEWRQADLPDAVRARLRRGSPYDAALPSSGDSPILPPPTASTASAPVPQPGQPRLKSDPRVDPALSADAAEALLNTVRDALDSIKAKDVREIDVRGKTGITDWMFIASGTSSRHVKSIADELVRRAKAIGNAPLGVEGEREGEWVLVDLGDAIVHVMLPRVREFYQLERLWSVGDEAADEAASDQGGAPAA